MSKFNMLYLIILILFFSACSKQIQDFNNKNIAKEVSITGIASNLSKITSSKIDDYVLNPSPNGRWLLLKSVDQDGKSILKKYNLKKSTSIILTSSANNISGGDWMPNMKSIIYSTNRLNKFVLVKTLGVSGGVGVKYITKPGLGNARLPDVSTNGEEIAFSIFESSYNNQIAKIDSSGENLQLFGNGYSPEFSPNHKKLIFVRKTGDFTHIFSCKASNGNALTQLTSGNSNNYSPSWSPNGNYITFVSDRTDKSHLYIMNKNGKNLTQLTQGNFKVSTPKWSDQGYIYFTSNAGGNWDIWKVKIDNRKL